MIGGWGTGAVDDRDERTRECTALSDSLRVKEPVTASGGQTS